MKIYGENNNRKQLLSNAGIACIGLVFFGFGVYLTIQANIGVAPWDVLNQGIANRTGLLYGTVLMGISVIVLLLDVAMKEPIGLGMILDTLIVGKTVDLCNWLDIVPARTVLWQSLLCMFGGLFIMSCAMRIYMSRGLGCGPRDTLLVALCKRMPRLPIGAVNVLMWATVTLIGWLLGGQVGIGTLISVFCMGPILQTVCKRTGFDAAKQIQQNIVESARILAHN